LGGGCLQGVTAYINDDLNGLVQTGYRFKTHEKTQPFNSELSALGGIMQLLAILLVRSRSDWFAGVGSPLAGDHPSQATFRLHDPVGFIIFSTLSCDSSFSW
jgi:hypothetical protein